MHRSRLAAKAAVERHAGIVARFWTHVDCQLDEAHCWNWHGRLDRNTDPVLDIPGGKVSAVSLAWYVVLDEFPVVGHALRRCGNVHCVRPTHLRWKVSARARAWMEAIDDGYLRHTGSPTVARECEVALRAGAVRDEGPDRAAS
jgi:hypothetical protein